MFSSYFLHGEKVGTKTCYFYEKQLINLPDILYPVNRIYI